jgi:hypothetical protein
MSAGREEDWTQERRAGMGGGEYPGRWHVVLGYQSPTWRACQGMSGTPEPTLKVRASPLGVLKGPPKAYESRRRRNPLPAAALISEFPPARPIYLAGGPR